MEKKKASVVRRIVLKEKTSELRLGKKRKKV